MSSDAALAGAPPLSRAPKLWEQIALSADNPDILWLEGAVQQQQQPVQQSRDQDGGETTAETPVPGEPVQSSSPPHANLSKSERELPV